MKFINHRTYKELQILLESTVSELTNNEYSINEGGFSERRPATNSNVNDTIMSMPPLDTEITATPVAESPYNDEKQQLSGVRPNS